MATGVDEDELGGRHARRGWKGRSEVNVTDPGRGGRHVSCVCEQYTTRTRQWFTVSTGSRRTQAHGC